MGAIVPIDLMPVLRVRVDLVRYDLLSRLVPLLELGPPLFNPLPKLPPPMFRSTSKLVLTPLFLSTQDYASEVI